MNASNRIQTNGSGYMPTVTVIGVDAGHNTVETKEIKQANPVNAPQVPLKTNPSQTLIANKDPKRDFSLQIARKAHEVQLHSPEDGFSIFNPSSTENKEVLHRILGTWGMAYKKWRDAPKDALPRDTIPQELHSSLIRILELPESDFASTYDSLFKTVIDKLAGLGIILDRFQALGDSVTQTYIYKPGIPFMVTKEEAKTGINLIDGTKKEFNVAQVSPFPNLPYETPAFINQRRICLYPDAYRNNLELDERRRLELIRRLGLNAVIDVDFTDAINIPDFTSGFFREDMNPLLQALQFSRFKLLNMKGAREADELALLLERVKFYFAQQIHDYQDPALSELVTRAGINDRDAEVFLKFRATINELQGSPRYFLQYAIESGIEYSTNEKISRKSLADGLVLRLVLKIIAHSPETFGIKVIDHPKVSREAQIYGQLYKLVEGENPKKIFECLRLYSESLELLFGIDLLGKQYAKEYADTGKFSNECLQRLRPINANLAE